VTCRDLLGGLLQDYSPEASLIAVFRTVQVFSCVRWSIS